MDKRLQELKRLASLGEPLAQERYIQARIRAGKRVLLGMSFSFCIASLLNEHVTEDEVVGIIGSTNGAVKNGQRGPNYSTIIDRYMDPYWRGKHSRQDVEVMIDKMMSRITEEPHGLPGTWVDASKPHYWGWVPHGCNVGIVGDYINVETNETTYLAKELETRFRKNDRPVSLTKMAHAVALNYKYGFVNPATRQETENGVGSPQPPNEVAI